VRVAVREGNAALALRLAGTVEVLRSASGERLGALDAERLRKSLEVARAALPHEAAEAAWREGQEAIPDEVIRGVLGET